MNEVRENIQGLFDYCGDIKKNGDNIRSAQYSKGYSPNNIRTVVISAEGILVRLHKAYTGVLPKGAARVDGKTMYLQFSPYKLYKQDANGNMDTGISIFRMLVKPLVCASIEEIIILQGVTNEEYYQYVNIMMGYDLNREDLMKGFRRTVAQSSDLTERFSRLHEIAEVNLNFFSFINSYKQNREVIERTNFLCDSLRNLITNSEKFNEDCWWNGINLQPSTYSLDIELKKYFEDIKTKYDKLSKDAKIQESKEKLYKKDVEGLDYAIERYISLCSIPMKMRAIVASGESNGVVTNLNYPVLQYAKVVDYPGFPKGVRESFIDKESKMSAKEAIKHNKSVVSSISSIVTLTSKAFIDTLSIVHKESPITFRIIMKKIKELVNDNNIQIIVPSDCRVTVDIMKADMEGLDFNCDGKRMAQSIVNAVWLYNVCFIENNANTNKYNDASTWANMIAKKGARS